SAIGRVRLGSIRVRQDLDSWKLSHCVRSNRDVPVWFIDLSERARKCHWTYKLDVWCGRRSLSEYRASDCGSDADANSGRATPAERIRYRLDQRNRSGSAIPSSARMVFEPAARAW